MVVLLGFPREFVHPCTFYRTSKIGVPRIRKVSVLPELYTKFFPIGSEKDHDSRIVHLFLTFISASNTFAYSEIFEFLPIVYGQIMQTIYLIHIVSNFVTKCLLRISLNNCGQLDVERSLLPALPILQEAK